MTAEEDRGGLTKGPQVRKVAGFKIDTGIPVPGNHHAPMAMAIDSLEIGESLLVPNKTASQVHGNFSRFAPRKFKARTLTKGVRIWRIA